MELSNKLLLTLQKIKFCERYQLLSEKNQFSDNDKTLESERVLELLKNFGYEAKFNKKESFYKLVQKQGDFKFQFNISLRNGNVELIWGVWYKEQILDQLSGPWGVLYKLALKTDNRPLMPKFRNYKDLEAILKEAFSTYEDFKHEMIQNPFD